MRHYSQRDNLVKQFDKLYNILEKFDQDSEHATPAVELQLTYDRLIGKSNTCILGKLKRLNSINIRQSMPSSTVSTEQHKDIKLPEITLPTFSRNLLECPRFRDIFQSVIVDSSNLSNVKFVLLFIKFIKRSS